MRGRSGGVRAVGSILILLVGAATLSGPAMARQEGGFGGPPRGGGGGMPGPPPMGGGRGQSQRPMTLAEIPLPVLAMGLRLSEAQAGAIERAQQDFRQQMRAMRPRPGQQNGPPDAKMQDTAMAKRQELTRSTIAAITASLTPQQRAQLPALERSVKVLQGIGAPLYLYGQLRLSMAQEQQIATLLESGPADVQQSAAVAQQSNQFGAGVMAARQARRKQRARIREILTPEQQEMIDYAQPPYPMPPGGGIPGGGQGGPGGMPGGSGGPGQDGGGLPPFGGGFPPGGPGGN